MRDGRYQGHPGPRRPPGPNRPSPLVPAHSPYLLPAVLLAAALGLGAVDGARAQAVPADTAAAPPASQVETQPPAPVPRMEIDGLVVDETITKVGRDFYDLFFARWQRPRDAYNYTIVVQEQPLPNLGTLVKVLVNDEVAYQSRLQPRYELIEEAARQAAAYTYHRVANRDAGPLIY